MASNSVPIFLVTANRLLRDTLTKVLHNKGGFNVCGASPCVPGACGTIVASGAEILVLDSITPNLPGGSLITEILSQSAGIKVVLIDMDEDPEIFLECVCSGAMGYLLKDASAAEVLASIRAISYGQAVYPSQIFLPLLQSFSREPATFPSARLSSEVGLTRRQQQLLPLIAQGLTNKEIASHLNLSEQTIKNHVHNMLRRVGANTRLQVIDVTNRQQAQLET